MAVLIREHELPRPANLVELLIQSPAWVILYSTGLVVFAEPFQWMLYGLGIWIRPDRYPLPHITLLDFAAHCL
jgi:hypothetical protein